MLNSKTPFVVLVCDIFFGVKVGITPTSTKKFCKAGIGIPGIDKNRKIARGDKCICFIGKLIWLTVMT